MFPFSSPRTNLIQAHVMSEYPVLLAQANCSKDPGTLYCNRREKLTVKNTPLGIHLGHLPHSHCTTCRTVQTERRKVCGAESGGGSHREGEREHSVVQFSLRYDTIVCLFRLVQCRGLAQYPYDMLQSNQYITDRAPFFLVSPWVSRGLFISMDLFADLNKPLLEL